MAMETWSPPQGGYWGGFGAPNTRPPGEGWAITGYNTRRVQTNNPKMGSGYKTIQIPIYSRMAPQAAPPPAAPAPAPAPKPAPSLPSYTPPVDSMTLPEEDPEIVQRYSTGGTGGGGGETASFATTFRAAQSARGRAGRRAQGTSSMKVPSSASGRSPFSNAFGVGINTK